MNSDPGWIAPCLAGCVHGLVLRDRAALHKRPAKLDAHEKIDAARCLPTCITELGRLWSHNAKKPDTLGHCAVAEQNSKLLGPIEDAEETIEEQSAGAHQDH